MKFEVRNREGKTVMQTKYKSCIYPVKIRNELRRAGYKLYLDGKPMKKGGDT